MESWEKNSKNMAAAMSLEVVKDVIKKNVNEELHITKSISRLCLFNEINYSTYFVEIISEFVSIYNSVLNDCENFSNFSFKFYKLNPAIHCTHLVVRIF